MRLSWDLRVNTWEKIYNYNRSKKLKHFERLTGWARNSPFNQFTHACTNLATQMARCRKWPLIYSDRSVYSITSYYWWKWFEIDANAFTAHDFDLNRVHDFESWWILLRTPWRISNWIPNIIASSVQCKQIIKWNQ